MRAAEAVAVVGRLVLTVRKGRSGLADRRVSRVLLALRVLPALPGQQVPPDRKAR